MTILFSDRGLPKNYRQMHGFGSHTYSFINAANERFWVKFHFKSLQGIENVTNAEAARAGRRRPRDASARPVPGHRARRVPEVALLRPDHAGDRRPRPIASTRST